MRSLFIKVHRRSGVVRSGSPLSIDKAWDERQPWAGTPSTVVQRRSAAFVYGFKVHAFAQVKVWPATATEPATWLCSATTTITTSLDDLYVRPTGP
jgi:hypothetical protein